LGIGPAAAGRAGPGRAGPSDAAPGRAAAGQAAAGQAAAGQVDAVKPDAGKRASRGGRRRAPGTKPPRPALGRGITAGQVLARVTLLPPLLVMAWLLPGLPLLLAGQFTVGLMLATSVPIAIALIVAVFFFAPVPWPHRRTPWWTVAAVTAVAVGFGVWQAAMHSQQVIVRRDPATYLQFGYWIAQHGSLPIPQLRSAFGGALPGLGFASLGFYQHGAAIVPQFMAGLPITLAAAFWINGIQLAVFVAPVIGACAVLTFGGFVGRLCGPRWAPLGALALALSLPEQYTSRSTFSEPLAQILLFGGFCLVTDAVLLAPRRRAVAARGGAQTQVNAAAASGEISGAAQMDEARSAADAAASAGADVTQPIPIVSGSSSGRAAAAGTAAARNAAGAAAVGAAQVRMRRSAWLMAALGGLAFGLSTLVRIDGMSDILPVILFCGVIYAARRTVALPLAAGLVLGAGYGLADGYLLSRPYLNSLSSLMRPLGYAAAVFAALTVALVVVSRWRRLPQLRRGRWSWVPDIASVAVVLIMLGFAIRPLFQTVRGETNPVTIAFIAEVQKLAQLPIDPHRTYAEDSLYWVIWYIGLPAVLLATFGAALLARRFLRGSALTWGLPVMVIGWSVVTTLWKPGIVPDQPWASRRLVPIVLPGLLLFAVWTCAWLVRRARARGAGAAAQGAVAACCAVALLLPTAVTTLGLGLGRAPQGGIRIVADGLGLKRTDTGEITVVGQLCRAIGPRAAVVIVDPLTADRFTEIVRGMCGVPAARMNAPSPAALAQVTAGIQRAGRRPVLLAAQALQLTSYGDSARRVVYRATRQDEHRLTQPPTTTWRILYQVWMSVPGQQPLP
jgi:hypothetical protein